MLSMKYIHTFRKVLSTGGLLALAIALPVSAGTEGLCVLPVTTTTSPDRVWITEVQTGAGEASDEFIELYNASDAPIAIGGWQIRSRNADAASDETDLVATIGDGVSVPTHEHFVVHTASVALPAGVSGQEYGATLSDKPKAIGLYAPHTADCVLRVVDAVAWGGGTKGEGATLPAGDDGQHKYISRYVTDGHYQDTDNNSRDFGMQGAAPIAELPVLATGTTPGALNGQALPAGDPAPASDSSPSALAAVPIKGCGSPPPTTPTLPPAPPLDGGNGTGALPPPPTPVRNVGLFAPQLSELLPNPAKPQTDANDEFVELYNPNDVAFDLSDFKLETGTKAKKRYSFPAGTLLAPKSFNAFLSKDTSIALANTSGQVRLLDTFGRMLAEATYTGAHEGYAWLLASAVWQWTTMPTPGALNIVKAPTDKPGKSTSPKSDANAKTTAPMQSKKPTASGANKSNADAPAKLVANTNSGGLHPLHPAILALTGVIAVLYGVYEYRHDLANKFHQLRIHRAARRSLGQAAKRG
jgi:hypothetical protein